jgi:hypothetical protein
VRFPPATYLRSLVDGSISIPQGSSSAFELLILRWMASESLSIREAAERIGFSTNALRGIVCPWRRGKSGNGKPYRIKIKDETVSQLAFGLGAVKANGWDREMWAARLLAVRPGSRPEERSLGGRSPTEAANNATVPIESGRETKQ